jgi:hypothetical protein
MAKPKSQKKPSPAPMLPVERPLFGYAMLASFGVLLLMMLFFKISGDDDFYWHLATGRYIVQTHSVPSTDVFSFSTPDILWIPFAWGWDVLTYLVFSATGYAGIYALKVIIFSLLFGKLFITMQSLKIDLTICVLVLVTLLFGMMDRITIRPHIFSLWMFAVLSYVLFGFRYFWPKENEKWIWIVPIIFLVWMNMHLSVIAGILFVGIFTIGEAAAFFFPEKFQAENAIPATKQRLVWLVAVTVLAMLSTLATPQNVKALQYILKLDTTPLAFINEWRSPFEVKYSNFVTTIYKTHLAIGTICLYACYKRRDLTMALLFIAFALYSTQAVRLTVDFIIITTVYVAFNVNYLFNLAAEAYPQIRKALGVPTKVALTLLMLAAAVTIPSGDFYLKFLKYYRAFGTGLDERFYPVPLFDFLKQHNISGKPLNHYGSGGLLAWERPSEKTYIDGRLASPQIFEEYQRTMSMQPGFEKTLALYGFDYAIYLAPDLLMMPDEMRTSIIKYFSTQPDWALVYWDDRSFLFLKRTDKFKSVIEGYEYKVLNPYKFAFAKPLFDAAATANPDAAKKELNRKFAEEPQGVIFQYMQQSISALPSKN